MLRRATKALTKIPPRGFFIMPSFPSFNQNTLSTPLGHLSALPSLRGQHISDISRPAIRASRHWKVLLRFPGPTGLIRMAQREVSRTSMARPFSGITTKPYLRRKPMRLNVRGTSALTRLVLLVVFSAAWQAHAHAQNAKTPYPSMAPLDQYLMERNGEIALARSPGPRTARLRKRRQGQQRLRVHGGTILDRRNRRSRFLESQAARCDLLQRAFRANLPSHHHQEDRTGIGRTIKSAHV